jgi:flagellin
LDAAASASLVNRSLETSMERLSTGNRINSASDDAAGVAISSRLTAEIRGTNQAIRNALDAQALIDTAEGAHKEVGTILQRMREIAVQASNDTNSSDDRKNLQTEMDALVTEIDRIAHVTTWANHSLMDGDTSVDSTKTFSFQVGSTIGTGNQIEVSIDSMSGRTLNLLKRQSLPRNVLLVVQDTDFTSGRNANSVDADGDGTTDNDTALDNSLKSISVIDALIKTVNTQRSELGAVANRLNHTVNNLTNISTNLSAARGGIEDADFALETTELAKNQILQQASTAMLAQANASKQNVLGLLRS